MAITWTTDTSATDNFLNTNLYGGLGQGEGIDLRIEMHRLLYGTVGKVPKGHWVILRKIDTSRPATTFNPSTAEGVNGPAYEYVDQIVRTRRIPAAKRADQLDIMKPGAVIGDTFTYYFEYTITPKVGYEIIEVDPSFDHTTTSPNFTNVALHERLLIKRLHPYRLENGNIQYWAAVAEVDQTRY